MKSILFIFLTTFITYFGHDLGSIFYLGPISFKVVDSGKSNRLYVWLHGDEKTAEMALDFHINNYKGKALYIQSDERVFRINGNNVDQFKKRLKLGTNVFRQQITSLDKLEEVTKEN